MIALTLVVPGDRARVELDKVRAAITKLIDEQGSVESATLQPADAFNSAMREIRKRADADQNSMSYLARPDGLAGQAAAPMALLDTWAQIWQVIPDVFEKGLREYFERTCRDPGLPLAKRPERMRQIEEKLEELREEEERVWLDLLSRNLLAERPDNSEQADIDRVLRVWDRVA